MPHSICLTCGTQFAETASPPNSCPVCEDPRQFVNANGQQWTTLDRLRRSHKNTLRSEEPGLISLGVEPHFAIGQRAFFLRSPGGNVLWDCLPLIDDALAEAIRAMGGVSAVAISHPHYYASMVEWSRALGGVPILLHEADRQWVMRPDLAVVFWGGETKAFGEELTLVRCGGHFDGGTVLHWAGGAEGRGVLCSGDILQVTPDGTHVSFMWSYPNYVPLGAAGVRRVAAAVEPFAFERIYGAFGGRTIDRDAKAAVARSTERYLRAIAV
jgi:hypothetical protein